VRKNSARMESKLAPARTACKSLKSSNDLYTGRPSSKRRGALRVVHLSPGLLHLAVEKQATRTSRALDARRCLSSERYPSWGQPLASDGRLGLQDVRRLHLLGARGYPVLSRRPQHQQELRLSLQQGGFVCALAAPRRERQCRRRQLHLDEPASLLARQPSALHRLPSFPFAIESPTKWMLCQRQHPSCVEGHRQSVRSGLHCAVGA
jgi:hypothetical protein